MNVSTKRTPPKNRCEAHWQLIADSFDEIRKEIGQNADKWEKFSSLLHEACFGDDRPYEQIEFDLKKMIEEDYGSSSPVPRSSD